MAVVGGSEPGGEIEETAAGVGRAVARAGAVLVCGGLGGVMEAACRGAKSAGGVTVGILPGLARADGNPFLDVALPSGMGEMRNALIVRAADVVIALDGGYGTLSEIAFALRTDKPVVGLETWRPAPANGRSRGPEHGDPIVRATSPEEAVELALGLLG